MISRKRMLWGLVLVLLLAVACNLPSRSESSTQGNAANIPVGDDSIQSPANNAEPELSAESPTETTAATPEPETETTSLPEFKVGDPCSIVPAGAVETVLGQAAEPIPGEVVCVYTNGMASITISALYAEMFKPVMVSQILQLENDCSMTFSYDSDAPDPTPLPSEADQYLAMSMKELVEKSLDLTESCGGEPYEILIDYGPGVYLFPTTVLMPGGQVSIAYEDYILTILYVDMEKDADEAVEVARQLLALIAAQ